MATILFDIFPATGHYNATFKLARLLKDRGHRIVYIGAVEFSGKVTALGFEYHPINPFIFRQDKAEIIQKGWITYILECSIDSFSTKKYDETVSRSKEYDKLIIKYSPGLIILDDHYISKAIFYYKYKTKVVAVQSMIAKERDTWVPPFQYAIVPKLQPRYKLLINWLWFVLLFKKRTKINFYKILSFGQDSFSLMKKIAQENGFPFQENINYNLSLGVGFKNIPVFKLSPRHFDFPREYLHNHYYIGPLIDLEREMEITDLRYMEIIKQITKNKKGRKGTPLIYCSLGTVTNAEMNSCDTFFKKIVGVCNQNPHYKIILSVGKYYDIDHLTSIPANLYVFQQVPQIDLLSHCDLMINHGGINSISECVFAGVPMLAYPLSPNWDQNGCAARIVYHGLGLKGNIKRDNVKNISAKILTLIENHGTYKENVLKMRAKFEEMNNSKEAVNIIEGLIKDYEFKIKCPLPENSLVM